MIARPHFLSPLLAPRSVALVGGSPKQGSVGELMVRTLLRGGYGGDVTVVNPKYNSVGGLRSVASLRDLPAPPDLAVLSVSSERMESVMRDAISTGARSAVIFDFCQLEGESESKLLDRLKAMAAEAAFPVCGGNGMGFFNFDARTFVSFQEPSFTAPGHIAAICHSGSVFAMLADSAGRYGFNLLTAQGQEISGTAADYMDFALELPTTRVIALFLESVRDPARFVAALEKAAACGIPVVVTKVGRTEASARLAVTHSGALAGNDTAFEALCDRYGVLRTDDLDSLMAACQILSLDRKIGTGKLAALLDSGGLRELMIDLAEEKGVEFAELTPSSVDSLRKRLYFGLEAVNPLDAAGLYNEDLGEVIGGCLDILAGDPNVAIVAHEYFSTDTTEGVAGIAEAARRTGAGSRKPYVLTYSLGSANNLAFATRMRQAGVPVINGIGPLLAGLKCAFRFRDQAARKVQTLPELDTARLAEWSRVIAGSDGLGEAQALQLLSDCGIDVARSIICDDVSGAVQAAVELNYPVAVKTAAPGIVHKSDVGGVHLNILNEEQVRRACDAMLHLGNEVCVAEMVPKGAELAFGALNDPQFGPVVMVGAGGTLVEIMDDRAFALAPVTPAEAKDMIGKLRIAKVLAGARGAAAINIDKLSEMFSRFSVACHLLRHVLSEIDVNPIIATPGRIVAVDAVLATGQQPSGESS
jgi:acyl-CoA synthetase (NDP forming)